LRLLLRPPHEKGVRFVFTDRAKEIASGRLKTAADFYCYVYRLVCGMLCDWRFAHNPPPTNRTATGQGVDEGITENLRQSGGMFLQCMKWKDLRMKLVFLAELSG
jgi:hypothetical protein